MIRSKGPQFYNHNPLPKDTRAKLAELKTILQCWVDVFEGFLISSELDIFDKEVLSPQEIKDTISHHTLMIQRWISYIWLYTPFSRVQTVFDAYTPAFTTITNLAEEILRLQPGRQWYYNLTADTQVIQPLVYVATKCRDGNLRRRAHAILADAGREGVWDGQCSAAACAWIIAKEEEGLEEGVVGNAEVGSKGYVEERYRLKGPIVKYNRFGRMLEISCSRTREDGSDELIEGFKQWGTDLEIQGVVYGEPDKLWQNGALFG